MEALQKVFEAYDIMRSEGYEDPPPWQSTDESTEGLRRPMDEKQQTEQKEPNWNDVRAQKEEKAAKLLEERYRASHSNKLLLDRIRKKDRERDEVGLQKAYENPAGIAYDSSTKSLIVKGTSSAQDVWDDLKIPFHMTEQSDRYRQAEKVYLQLAQQGQPVDTVIGHSLGGSVALALAKNYGLQSRTYGAPVLDLNPFQRTDRYRYILDPVSMLDRGANTSWSLHMNPHSYGGLGAMRP